MAVAFEELEGSPTYSGRNGALVGQRIFKVAWASRHDFYKELWGLYRNIGGTTTNTGPAKFPGISSLVIANVSIEPFDPTFPLGQAAIASLTSEPNAYDYARVTAQYLTRSSSMGASQQGGGSGGSTGGEGSFVPEGTNIAINGSLSAEYLTTPGRTWKWDVDDTPLPDDLNPGLLIPCRDIQISWWPVAKPPWSAIDAAIGKANTNLFLGRYPAGTVLFLGENDSTEFQLDEEDPVWRLEYHFKYKPNRGTSGGAAKGWNYFYRQAAASGEHWLKIEDSDGNPPFASTSFASLFLFG